MHMKRLVLGGEGDARVASLFGHYLTVESVSRSVNQSHE